MHFSSLRPKHPSRERCPDRHAGIRVNRLRSPWHQIRGEANLIEASIASPEQPRAFPPTVHPSRQPYMVSLLASVQEHASSGSKFHTKQTDAEHDEEEQPEEKDDEEEEEPVVREEVPFPVP